MRTGGYTLQHSLTPESTAIIKQALTLARRRGHAQVSPLHVSSAMLASSTGLFKTACLLSHSHPLQCKALELCFNVALNRLPTSAGTPLLGSHYNLPSLSNALVAAFKRAQAHQRRGSIENQQQSILALKVEIEQLVISILDDPSVSRVMREAGFSSTQVKADVEKTVSLENITSPSPPVNNHSKELSAKTLFSKTVNHHQVENDDVMSVIEAMMSKNTKNIVIVSDYPTTSENIIRGVINKVDKKDVPVEMRFVQFISVPLFTLRNISREEFEVKLRELRSLVKSHMEKGVVLYLGDLCWVSEFWSKYGEKNNGWYSPVEYMIMEISKLICGAGDTTKLWLIGAANFQTYAKCKIGRPSLETLWSLCPLTIPAGSLTLSLSLDHSGIHDYLKTETVDDFNCLLRKSGINKQLICCSDCSVNFRIEVEAIISTKQNSIPSSYFSLPSWLQHHKDEGIIGQNNVDEECDKIKDLCKKWNSICKSVHTKKQHFLKNILNLATPSPSSSTSISSNKSNLHQSLINWPVIFKPSRPSLSEHKIFICKNENEVSKPTKPDLLSNPNSSPNSASSSKASDEIHIVHKFDEFNQENINILSNALEKKVPWQGDIIPDIATTVLKCRSRNEKRNEIWLLFLGADADGKETIAKELAKAMFGSHDNFIKISLSSFSSSTKCDSSEEVCNNKRSRNEHGGSAYERFLDVIHDNPSRVCFIEDIDQFDYRCLKGFKRVMQDGSFTLGDGEVVLLKDAIVIFDCENAVGKKFEKAGEESDEDEEECRLLDLNVASDDQDGNEIEIFGLVDKQVVFKIQVL